MPPRPWTEEEIKCAREMYAAGYFYGEIDKALRRRAGSTKHQFEGVGYGSGQKRLIPDVLLVEREALTDARNRRTLTQERSAARLLGAARQDRAAMTRPASLAARFSKRPRPS